MTGLPISNQIQNVGSVQIADEVIAVIAGTAALEVDGVISMAGNITGDLIAALGVRNLSKGVKVTVNGNDVSLDINVLVRFGMKIQEVALDIQKKVKTAIETMIGLNAVNINVNITGVHITKEKPPKEDKFRDE